MEELPEQFRVCDWILTMEEHTGELAKLLVARCEKRKSENPQGTQQESQSKDQAQKLNTRCVDNFHSFEAVITLLLRNPRFLIVSFWCKQDCKFLSQDSIKQLTPYNVRGDWYHNNIIEENSRHQW